MRKGGKTKAREVLKSALYEEDVDVFGYGEGESAKTVCILGRSFSGKTHFLVEELNKLVGRTRKFSGTNIKRPLYDKIILFTESLSADPLKDLDPRLDITLIQGYIPKIVQLLKRINTITDNKFRFLVILDDVVNGIRAGTFAKQILTMRNSNISTCILIQYVKLISPAMRNSVHHYYITGLKPEEWEYLVKSFLVSLIKELIGSHGTISNLSIEFKNWVADDVVHYDQRRDELSFIGRELKNKIS